jgi:hypothetical protein
MKNFKVQADRNDFSQLPVTLMCMSRRMSHTRTIKSTKLRWKIPKNFPDRHRPSNGL